MLSRGLSSQSETFGMRGWIVGALLLAGCQSSPDVALTAGPTPVQIASPVAAPFKQKRLALPQAEQSVAVSRPEQLSQPKPQLYQPPRSQETEAFAVAAPTPRVDTALAETPRSGLKPEESLHLGAQPLPLPYPSPAMPPIAAVPPTRVRPPMALQPPTSRPPGYPGMARPQAPGAMAPAPPRLPGQGARHTNPAFQQAREQELEQVYRQSRADALNLKYHQGRAILNANSPEVFSSAQAPPPVIVHPTLPGQNPVHDAFQQSEHRRQELQRYRDEQHRP